MIQITFKPKKHFSEAIAAGFEYSLLDSTYKAYHSPVQCKDFLTDAFWSEACHTPISIYSFEWKPGTIELNQPWYYMGLKYSKEPIGAYAKPVQDFIQEFDMALGFKKTTAIPVGDSLLLKFSGAWVKKPVLVSVFTQLVRLGPRYDGSDIKHWVEKPGIPFIPYDSERLNGIIPRLLKLLDGRVPNLTYKDYSDVRLAHSSSGLYNCDNW